MFLVDARLFHLNLAMTPFHTVVILSRHAMLHTVCFVLWHVGGLALLVALFVAVRDLFLLCWHKDRDALCFE